MKVVTQQPRMTALKNWIKLACILAPLVATTACGGYRKPPAGSYATGCGWTPGRHLCNFVAYDQYGSPREIHEWRGKPLVIQVSAMWCAGCVEATIDSARIRQLFEGSIGYAVLLVDGWDPGVAPPEEDVWSWAEELGIAGPVLAGWPGLIDPAGLNGFQVNGYPSIYIIDPEGWISHTQWGVEGLVDQINHVVLAHPKQEPPDVPPSTDSGCKHPESND